MHSLKNKTTIHGMIVTIESFDEVTDLFEVRLEKTKAIVKIGIGKRNVFKEGEVGKDPRENMMLLAGEEIKLGEGQCFRKTRDSKHGKPGYWRKYRGDGNFFKEKVERSDDVIISLWHNVEGSKPMQQYAAILELEKS